MCFWSSVVSAFGSSESEPLPPLSTVTPIAKPVAVPVRPPRGPSKKQARPLSSRAETVTLNPSAEMDREPSNAPSPSAPASGTAAPGAPEPDNALVALLQRGDKRAFREIVRRHQEKVYRLALRLTRDDARAQDVVQDAFLQVFRKIGQFQEQSAFSTWLYRISVNAALMRMRSERRHNETSLEDASPQYTEAGEIADPIDDWSEAVDDQASNKELAKHAADAVDKLPEAYRSVFILRELEDLSTEEVAQILDLTLPTVKTRLHRARLALRKSLADRVKGTDLEAVERTTA